MHICKHIHAHKVWLGLARCSLSTSFCYIPLTYWSPFALGLITGLRTLGYSSGEETLSLLIRVQSQVQEVCLSNLANHKHQLIINSTCCLPHS